MKKNTTVWIVFGGLVIVIAALLTFSQANTAPEPPTISENAGQLPESVVIDAGNPLSCQLLPEPKTIGSQTALYTCAAPGAYLASVDLTTNTAQYFTTNSQGDTITYGPTTVTVLSQL